jgi:hypothetical protein
MFILLEGAKKCPFSPEPVIADSKDVPKQPMPANCKFHFHCLISCERISVILNQGPPQIVHLFAGNIFPKMLMF